MIKFFISEKEGEWKLINTETGKETLPLKENFKLLTKTYNENKPTLKECDIYELLLCNLAITNNSEITGQLFYKKNRTTETLIINKQEQYGNIN